MLNQMSTDRVEIPLFRNYLLYPLISLHSYCKQCLPLIRLHCLLYLTPSFVICLHMFGCGCGCGFYLRPDGSSNSLLIMQSGLRLHKENSYLRTLVYHNPQGTHYTCWILVNHVLHARTYSSMYVQRQEREQTARIGSIVT